MFNVKCQMQSGGIGSAQQTDGGDTAEDTEDTDFFLVINIGVFGGLGG